MLLIAVLGDDRPTNADVTAFFVFAYKRIEQLPKCQERRSQWCRKANASSVSKLELVAFFLKRPSRLAVCGTAVSQVSVPVHTAPCSLPTRISYSARYESTSPSEHGCSWPTAVWGQAVGPCTMEGLAADIALMLLLR